MSGCTGNDDNDKNTEETIEKVEINPENPTSSDTIRIELFLNEPYKTKLPNIRFISLFKKNEELDGETLMERANDKEFYIEVGPLKEYDQIWFIIYLFKGDEVIIYDDTIDIGSFEYSQDLNINVTYSEDEFKNQTSSNITADIFYGDSISGIQIHYYRIKLNPDNSERECMLHNSTPVNFRERIAKGHERCKTRESNIESNLIYLLRWVCFDKSNLFSTSTYRIDT